jgi:hypothetical protein
MEIEEQQKYEQEFWGMPVDQAHRIYDGIHAMIHGEDPNGDRVDYLIWKAFNDCRARRYDPPA